MEVKAIIFDWGRTLFDIDAKKEFSDSEEVLSYCKQKGYRLCVASIARSDTAEKRKNQIETSSLYKYFEMTEVTDGKEKDEMLDELVQKLNLPREEILLVDDRVVKSIKYGNKNGHPTVWLQKGPFANELPSSDTGTPTYTIKSLLKLKNII
jgi:FMN phosphatase YigB (HAD superfamily)